MGVSLCPKCGNWYADVPVPDGVGPPFVCAGYGKSQNHSHFGQESATQQEIASATFLAKAKGALAGAPGALAEAEALARAAGEMLRLADAFELPGREDRLWVNESGMVKLTDTSRRPPEDLATVRRSVRNVQAQVSEAMSILAQARLAAAAPQPSSVVPTPVTQPVPSTKKPRSEAQKAATLKWQAAARARREAKGQKFNQAPASV